jgi:hypothetical protein
VLSVVAAAVIGVGVSFIGADLLNKVLLTQVQLHRAIWLLHVVSYICAGILLCRVWSLREDGFALVAFLAFATFVTFAMLPLFGVVLAILGTAVSLLRVNGRLAPLARPLQIAAIALAVLVGGGLLAYRVVSIGQKIITMVPTDSASVEIFAFATVLDTAVIATVAMMMLRCCPAVVRKALPAVAAFILVGSAIVWDRSSAWSRTASAEEVPVESRELCLGDARRRHRVRAQHRDRLSRPGRRGAAAHADRDVRCLPQ